MAYNSSYNIDIKMSRIYSIPKSERNNITGRCISVANEYSVSEEKFRQIIAILENEECSCGCGQKITLENFDME